MLFQHPASRTVVLLIALLALAAARAAGEELDQITLRSGCVLIGTYDKTTSVMILRGGVSGRVMVDAREIAAIARKTLAAPKGKEPATGAKADAGTLDESLAAAQKQVDEQSAYIGILDENITRQKQTAADLAQRQKELDERIALEEAKSGNRAEALRRQAEDLKKETAEADAGIPPLEQDRRQAQGKLLLTQKNVEKIMEKIAEARSHQPPQAKEGTTPGK